MRQRSPTHPGAILREDVLPSLPGMSVSAFARNLGESHQTLHDELDQMKPFTSAGEPVIQLQARHLGKLTHVVGNEQGLLA